MIPKIIHYCWLGGKPYSNLIKKCISSWKKHLPDYEYILWDEKKFNVESIPWTSQAYSVKKYAFAADYIRCYALHNYGGIYLDTDVQVFKSFNDLLENEYILGYETPTNSKRLIESGVIGCKKNFFLMNKCLYYYKNRNFINKDDSLNKRTMPSILTELIGDPQKYNILNEEYFCPKNWSTKEINITKNTYCMHHFAGSWLSKSKRIKNKLRAKRKEIKSYFSKMFKPNKK